MQGWMQPARVAHSTAPWIPKPEVSLKPQWADESNVAKQGDDKGSPSKIGPDAPRVMEARLKTYSEPSFMAKIGRRTPLKLSSSHSPVRADIAHEMAVAGTIFFDLPNMFKTKMSVLELISARTARGVVGSGCGQSQGERPVLCTFVVRFGEQVSECNDGGRSGDGQENSGR